MIILYIFSKFCYVNHALFSIRFDFSWPFCFLRILGEFYMLFEDCLWTIFFLRLIRIFFVP